MNNNLINLFEGYLKETDIVFDLRESHELGLSSKKSDIYFFKVPDEHRMLTIEIKDDTMSIEHAITNDDGLFKNDYFFTHSGTNLNIRRVVSYYSETDSRSVEYSSIDKIVPKNFDFYKGFRGRTLKKNSKKSVIL